MKSDGRSTQWRSALSRSASSTCRCAAYDFQYVGKGYGVKDVAYLFASSLSAAALVEEEQLLAYYHHQLTNNLREEAQAGNLGAGAAEEYTAVIMKRHFELAVLDYVRFMAGWGFWGNSGWAERRAREALPAVRARWEAAKKGVQ